MRAVLVLAAALVLGGCGGSDDTAAPAQTGAGGSGRVAGTSLDGAPVSLDDFRGRPVLVNVWSSW